MNVNAHEVSIALTYTLLGGVLWTLYLRERREHLRWWSFGYAAYLTEAWLEAARGQLGWNDALATFCRLLIVVSATSVGLGVLRFLGDKRPERVLLAWLAVGTAGALIAVAFLPHQLAAFPIYMVLGTWLAWLAIALLRSRLPIMGRIIGGLSVLAAGLYSLGYPLLRQLPVWDSIEQDVDVTIIVAIANGLLLLHYEQLEAEARAKATQLRAIFDGAVDGLFVCDAGGRLRAANAACEAVLGTSWRARVEPRLSEVLDVDTATRSALEALWSAPEPRALELTARRPDGTPRTLLLQLRALPDGRVEGSLRDVTDERAIAERLRSSDRLESLGRLAGGIAHDFNNALTTVLAAANLAQRRVRSGQSPEQELEELQASVERAAGLTRQLLAFASRQVVERQPVDLVPLCARTVKMLRRVVDERIRLELSTEEDELVVLGSVAQLEQVLVNLVLNARDAIDGAGRVQLRLTASSDHARLTVTDDGCGIAPADIGRIFEPFFTTKEPGTGTGLGLASAHGTVTQLGGTLQVESTPGKGSCFTVELPLSELSPVPSSRNAPTATALRGLRVLLVEDQHTLRRLVAMDLTQAGCVLTEAADGLEARERLGVDAAAFDVIVSDIVMPRLGGVELVTEARALRPELPCVLLSGWPADALEQTLPPGVRVLAKPFVPDDLRLLLASVVSRRRELT